MKTKRQAALMWVVMAGVVALALQGCTTKYVLGPETRPTDPQGNKERRWR